jgi:serine/threonine protein kinase
VLCTIEGLTSILRVVIADFGTSSVTEKVSMTVVGTQEYMAPEVFEKSGYDPKMSDIWSLGILMFELISARRNSHEGSGRPSWEPFVDNAAAARVRDWQPLVDIFEAATSSDPQSRPSAADLEEEFAKHSDDMVLSG